MDRVGTSTRNQTKASPFHSGSLQLAPRRQPPVEQQLPIELSQLPDVRLHNKTQTAPVDTSTRSQNKVLPCLSVLLPQQRAELLRVRNICPQVPLPGERPRPLAPRRLPLVEPLPPIEQSQLPGVRHLNRIQMAVAGTSTNDLIRVSRYLSELPLPDPPQQQPG